MMTERDAAYALLQLREDLLRLLDEQPLLGEETEAWCEAIRLVLAEIARGRAYIKQIMALELA